MNKLGTNPLEADDYQLGLNMVFFRPGKQSFLQSILALDPSNGAADKIDQVRAFMNEKRILRAQGALRSMVRLRHGLNRRRVIELAQVTRIASRTLGRALLSARRKLNANAEKEEREARLKDAEYLQALQAKKDLVTLKERQAQEAKRMQAALESESKKQQKIADELARSKKNASAILKEQQGLRQSILEEKKAASQARSENSSLKLSLDNEKREVNALKTRLTAAEETVANLRAGAVVCFLFCFFLSKHNSKNLCSVLVQITKPYSCVIYLLKCLVLSYHFRFSLRMPKKI